MAQPRTSKRSSGARASSRGGKSTWRGKSGSSKKKRGSEKSSSRKTSSSRGSSSSGHKAARAGKKSGSRKKKGSSRSTPNGQRRWSRRVMQTSDALDLEPGVFKKRSARAIAQSLKRSAERSKRRKAKPFQSAMSMLVFHINRGGEGISASRRRTLERAKDELRRAFGREPKG